MQQLNIPTPSGSWSGVRWPWQDGFFRGRRHPKSRKWSAGGARWRLERWAVLAVMEWWGSKNARRGSNIQRTRGERKSELGSGCRGEGLIPVVSVAGVQRGFHGVGVVEVRWQRWRHNQPRCFAEAFLRRWKGLWGLRVKVWEKEKWCHFYLFFKKKKS